MKPNKFRSNMKLMLLLSVMCMSSACHRAVVEQRCTGLRPRPEPLPPEILLLMQPSSTELLKKAEDWYRNSGQVLDSVKTE